MISEPYLVDKNNNLIKIPCYEIGTFMKQIIENYINLNEKNKQEYEKFKNNYSHFNSDLDFLILKLGYKLINPLLTNNQDEIISKHNNIYLRHYNCETKLSPVDNEHFIINQINMDSFQTSVVSNTGLQYSIYPSSKIHVTHSEICIHILLDKILYNKESYLLYIKALEKDPHYKYDLEAFFISELGFLQIVRFSDDSGYIIYDSSKITEDLTMLLESIKNQYSKMSLMDKNPTKVRKM